MKANKSLKAKNWSWRAFKKEQVPLLLFMYNDTGLSVVIFQNFDVKSKSLDTDQQNFFNCEYSSLHHSSFKTSSLFCFVHGHSLSAIICDVIGLHAYTVDHELMLGGNLLVLSEYILMIFHQAVNRNKSNLHPQPTIIWPTTVFGWPRSI